MERSPLTHRQRRFVHFVNQGRSYAQAAREAGYSQSVANCAGRKIVSKPAVKVKLDEIQAQAELQSRVKPVEPILLHLEKLSPEHRGFVEAIARELAAKNFIYARINAAALAESCRQI